MTLNVKTSGFMIQKKDAPRPERLKTGRRKNLRYCGSILQIVLLH